MSLRLGCIQLQERALRRPRILVALPFEIDAPQPVQLLDDPADGALAFVGGFASPAIIGGEPNTPVLFGYLLANPIATQVQRFQREAKAAGRRTRSGRCARAVSGNATAEPATPVRKSRRRIPFPRLRATPNFGFQLRPSKQETRTSKMGVDGHWYSRSLETPMSALNQKQTFVWHVAYHSGRGRSLSDDTPATTFNAIEP